MQHWHLDDCDCGFDTCGGEELAAKSWTPLQGLVPVKLVDWPDFNRYANLYRHDLVTAFSVACRRWNFALEGLELHLTPREEDAVIRIYWVDMQPNSRGLKPYATANRTGNLRQAYDRTYPYWSRDILYRVALHEFGHSLGLGHLLGEERGVMRPGLQALRTLTDADLRLAVESGYRLRP